MANIKLRSGGRTQGLSLSLSLCWAGVAQGAAFGKKLKGSVRVGSIDGLLAVWTGSGGWDQGSTCHPKAWQTELASLG